MRQLLASFISIFFFHAVFAHPGIGIVKDSKGNIYYTDLKQVWKLSITGEKTVVVRNVHSHELYMDADDNLFGEHLWYNGEKANTWGHYVWCLKNNGELVNEIEPTEGFLNGYSFVRDKIGNMYWVERANVTRFVKKSSEGTITTISEGRFGFIGWLYSSDSGTLYFTEDDKLQKLTPDGKIVLLSDDLKTHTPAFTPMGRNYDGYGIWADKDDNIYIAMIGAKKINRVSPAGKVKTIYYAASLWTPSSGVFDNDGNLWLMEFSMTNETRVRKISSAELTTLAKENPFARQTQVWTTIMVALLAGICWMLLKLILAKQKRKPRAQLL